MYVRTWVIQRSGGPGTWPAHRNSLIGISLFFLSLLFRHLFYFALEMKYSILLEVRESVGIWKFRWSTVDMVCRVFVIEEE